MLDLLESFEEYHSLVIPRKKNVIADTVVVSANVFKIPVYPNGKYEIEVKHMATIPDNVNYWKVFDDDKKINRFIEMSKEFENLSANQMNMFEKYDNVVSIPDSHGYFT